MKIIWDNFLIRLIVRERGREMQSLVKNYMPMLSHLHQGTRGGAEELNWCITNIK